MFKKLGLQLYTIRDFMNNEEAVDAAFAKMAASGYTEVQTYDKPIPHEVMGKLAKRHGISIIGSHIPFDEIVNSPDEVMKTHEAWGTSFIGIGIYHNLNTCDRVLQFIENFNKAAALYAKNGFRLTYHNHSHEFAQLEDGKTAMDYLVEGLDPANTSFVMDTCWVANAGGDVRHWIEKLAGRIDILHLKDLKVRFTNEERTKFENVYTEVGAGNLWWDGIMESAKKAGVKHYCVELDRNWLNDSPFDSIAASASFLKKYQQ